MKKLMKAVAALLLACIVILGGGVLLAKNGVDNPISQAADQAGAGAANAALNAIGIKEKADALLRDNTAPISQMTGLPETMVDAMIDDLDIQSWQVATLPAGAVPTGSVDLDHEGTAITLTTYDDPSIVTVQTAAGAVTLSVPASAQSTIRTLQTL